MNFGDTFTHGGTFFLDYQYHPLVITSPHPQSTPYKPINPSSLPRFIIFKILTSWVLSLMRMRSLLQSPQPRCSRPLSLMSTSSSLRSCHKPLSVLRSLKEMEGLEASRRLLLVKVSSFIIFWLWKVHFPFLLI